MSMQDESEASSSRDGKRPDYSWSGITYSSKEEHTLEYNDTIPRSILNRLLFERAQRGDASDVRLLLEEGADVHARDEQYHQPLHVACDFGRADVVEVLINHGADVNGAPWSLETPLSIALKMRWKGCSGSSFEGYRRISEMLIDAGADVNAMIHPHWRPESLLHMLIGKGQLQFPYSTSAGSSGAASGEAPHDTPRNESRNLMTLLIEKGANVNIYGAEQLGTPLYHAAYNKELDATRFLLHYGASVGIGGYLGTPLHAAAARYDVPIIQLLLNKGADIEARNRQDRTPIMVAVQYACTESIRALIDAGADVHVRDKEGKTLLHSACRGLRDEKAKLLLDAGIKIDARNNQGNTPLHTVTYDRTTAEILIRLGANIEARNNDGDTPLCLAAGRHDEYLIKVLLDAGGSVWAMNNRGHTPLRIANKKGYYGKSHRERIQKLFTDKGATDSWLSRIWPNHQAQHGEGSSTRPEMSQIAKAQKKLKHLEDDDDSSFTEDETG